MNCCSTQIPWARVVCTPQDRLYRLELMMRKVSEFHAAAPRSNPRQGWTLNVDIVDHFTGDAGKIEAPFEQNVDFSCFRQIATVLVEDAINKAYPVPAEVLEPADNRETGPGKHEDSLFDQVSRGVAAIAAHSIIHSVGFSVEGIRTPLPSLISGYHNCSVAASRSPCHCRPEVSHPIQRQKVGKGGFQVVETG